MALPAGARLGLIEFFGALGAGGMSEVYKVQDTRLDRVVRVAPTPFCIFRVEVIHRMH